MPKARMIATNIGQNYRLAELPYKPHDAQKFFTWMIGKADREGRLIGDPKLLTKIVTPYCDYTPEEVEGWLEMMESLKDDETGYGLIERYEVNGHKYIWIPGWEYWQPASYRAHESPSKIPPHPASKGKRKTSKQQPQRADVDDIIDEGLAKAVRCYEDNIGIITPSAKETLLEMYDEYPGGWFEKAVSEAVKYNKRSLKYIEAILRRWKEEGVQTSEKHDEGDGTAGMKVEE